MAFLTRWHLRGVHKHFACASELPGYLRDASAIESTRHIYFARPVVFSYGIMSLRPSYLATTSIASRSHSACLSTQRDILPGPIALHLRRGAAGIADGSMHFVGLFLF